MVSNIESDFLLFVQWREEIRKQEMSSSTTTTVITNSGDGASPTITTNVNGLSLGSVVASPSPAATALATALIAHGADVNGVVHIGDGVFTTPLGVAALSNNSAATALLLSHGADPDYEGDGSVTVVSPTALITAPGSTASPNVIAIVTSRSKKWRRRRSGGDHYERKKHYVFVRHHHPYAAAHHYVYRHEPLKITHYRR